MNLDLAESNDQVIRWPDRCSRNGRKRFAVQRNRDNPKVQDQATFEPLLNLREAATLLGMHWKTLEGMARTERIPAFRIGGRWRFRASLLNKWLEKTLVQRDLGEVEWSQPVALREIQEQK